MRWITPSRILGGVWWNRHRTEPPDRRKWFEAGAPSAAVTPDPIAVPISLPAPTITVTALPDPLIIVVGLPAPSLTLTLAPDPLVIVLGTPDGTVGAAVTPDPLAVQVSLPAPTIGLSVTPDAFPIPIVLPAPTLGVGVNPDPVAVPIVVPDPALASGVNPDPLAVPIGIPAPTVSINLTPDPVAVPIVLPDPTVSVSTDAAVTPSPLPVPIVLPAPTLSVTINPDPLAVVIVLPVPTVTAVPDGVTPTPTPGETGRDIAIVYGRRRPLVPPAPVRPLHPVRMRARTSAWASAHAARYRLDTVERARYTFPTAATVRIVLPPRLAGLAASVAAVQVHGPDHVVRYKLIGLPAPVRMRGVRLRAGAKAQGAGRVAAAVLARPWEEEEMALLDLPSRHELAEVL